MTIITDIFVSTIFEVSSYPCQMENRFHRMRLTGLTPLEFGILWANMKGTEFTFDEHDLKEINRRSNTWLCQFPQDFVAALVALNKGTIPQLASQWMASGKLGYSSSDAQIIIAELVLLARAAQAESKSLFLWGTA